MRSRLSAFGLTAFDLSALALKCVRLNCVRLNCVCAVHLGEGACGKPTSMGGLAIRPRWIRLCARIRAISAAFIRRGFDWKLLLKKRPHGAAAVAEQTAKKKRRRPPPQRAAVAGIYPSGHGGVLKLH